MATKWFIVILNLTSLSWAGWSGHFLDKKLQLQPYDNSTPTQQYSKENCTAVLFTLLQLKVLVPGLISLGVLWRAVFDSSSLEKLLFVLSQDCLVPGAPDTDPLDTQSHHRTSHLQSSSPSHTARGSSSWTRSHSARTPPGSPHWTGEETPAWWRC